VVADWIRSLPTHQLGRDRGSAYSRPIIAMHLAAQTDQLELAEKMLREIHIAGGRQSLDVAIALLLTWERQGKYKAAEAEARTLLANPETVLLPYLYRTTTRAMLQADRAAEARAAAADAVRTAGGRSAIAMRLLEIETRIWFGEDGEAKSLARKLLEEYPKADDERAIRLRLAALLEHSGDPDSAERHLLRILELAPKDAGTHNNLGYYLAERGRRLDEAERLCRFAVASGRPAEGYDPGGDDPSYRDSLGWALFRRGRLRAAQAELEHALRLPGGKTDAVIWDHLGDAYAARGWPEKARGAWTEALARIERSISRRNDPRPEELRRKLAARTKD
jgi:tetratricopeptide (TPR) repeat protein